MSMAIPKVAAEAKVSLDQLFNLLYKSKVTSKLIEDFQLGAETAGIFERTKKSTKNRTVEPRVD